MLIFSIFNCQLLKIREDFKAKGRETEKKTEMPNREKRTRETKEEKEEKERVKIFRPLVAHNCQKPFLSFW